MPRLWRDASASALVAGFVTVLVGYTSSAAIVFEAARALGAGDREIASWMGALGVGMGFTCIALSLRWRVPVVTAWSTPGAASNPLTWQLRNSCRASRWACLEIFIPVELAGGIFGYAASCFPDSSARRRWSSGVRILPVTVAVVCTTSRPTSRFSSASIRA